MTIERRQRLLMAMFGCLTIAGLLLSQPSVSALCWASGWLWAVGSDLRRREIPDMAWALCLAAVLPAGGRALHWQNALPGLLPGVLFLLLTVAGAFEMGGGDIKLILAGGAAAGIYANQGKKGSCRQAAAGAFSLCRVLSAGRARRICRIERK